MTLRVRGGGSAANKQSHNFTGHCGDRLAHLQPLCFRLMPAERDVLAALLFTVVTFYANAP